MNNVYDCSYTSTKYAQSFYIIVFMLMCYPCMMAQQNQLYIRSALARTVYNKMLDDREEQATDHHYWYQVKEEKLSDGLKGLFVQCNEDVATQEFLRNCYQKSDRIPTQIYHMVVKSVLSWVLPATTINGFLGRGSMFVLSTAQFHKLMGIGQEWRSNKLLDLGAGDGRVTAQMADNFHQVYATEMSSTMVWRLQEKNYQVLGLDEWSDGTHKFDVISCMNLLDRCDRPVTILRQIKKSLVPKTGRLIVALVIPFKLYVEYGNHIPAEYLRIEGRTFEEQVSNFVHDVFEPHGFTVEKFTRVPYLCEGDLERSFYTLDNAVFVLKPL